jgi:hypothetical protein
MEGRGRAQSGVDDDMCFFRKKKNEKKKNEGRKREINESGIKLVVVVCRWLGGNGRVQERVAAAQSCERSRSGRIDTHTLTLPQRKYVFTCRKNKGN